MPVSTISSSRAVTFPGAVLQVVNASTSTAVTNTTNTYIDTGLTATITPTSSSSRILIIVSQSCYKSSGNSNNGLNIKLFRNSTDLGRIIYVQGYTGSAVELYSQATQTYVDSPSTTSAVTYKTQFANLVAFAQVNVQADSNGLSTITLLEIAA